MSATVRTQIETITPQKAQRWLQRTAPNRPLSVHYAKSLARAIQAGEWTINGETIKFDHTGQLIDGQHRLTAAVIADASVKSFVTRGLSDGTFDTIDTGRKRSVGDVFAKHNEANYRTLAGAVSWLWRHEGGYIAKGSCEAPRHPQALMVLRENPELRESEVYGLRVRALLAAPMATCLHYLCAQLNRDQADFFFEHLATGEHLAKNSRQTSSILWLRNRLQANRSEKAKLRRTDIWVLVVKAWNAYRAGRVVKNLKTRRTKSEDLAAERFPEIE